MKNAKILVVMHKPYTSPEDKELYLPIQSGAAISNSLGIQRDDEGRNISKKNVKFNELCPIYWAWKNLHADYIGICHYRRLFSDSKKNGTAYAQILKRDTLDRILDETDIVLPPMKNYYFLSVRQHYIHSVSGLEKIHEKDLAGLEEAISEVAPDYLSSYCEVMKRTKAHMLNMSIMKRDKYDEYCSFIFPVLFKTEELLKTRNNRFIGALGEFLLDTWIMKNHYRYVELGLVELERRKTSEKIWHFINNAILKRAI